MKWTRKNIVEGIYNKIDEMLTDSPYTKPLRDHYKKTLVDYPKEIEQNILEWINDEPITEVDCYGVSMKEVIDTIKMSEQFIPMLIQNFIKYKNDSFVDKLIPFDGFFME